MKRIFAFDRVFANGVRSDMEPAALPTGYYWMGVNLITVGGSPSCRPGYKCYATLPDGNLQGAFLFRPKLGPEQIVIVVSGDVFVSEWPFNSFRQLENIKLSPDAAQVFWCLTEQSAVRSTGDLESAIELITPRNILFIQDGGLSAPVWFDGSRAEHLRTNLFETPAGGPMAWVGDRLWVAVGSYVYASDIANPFSFREQLYLGGSSGFVFSGPVTALAKTPSLELPQLLVFTLSSCSLLNASIRERGSWLQTPNMQQDAFAIGCTSQRSVVSQFGQLAWFSPAGLTFLDTAIASRQEARQPIKDEEMAYSKAQLGDNLDLIAGVAYGNFLMMSVPAGGLHNQHTWVMSQSSMEGLTAGTSGKSWCGIWTGTSPVEWVAGEVAGSNRCFYVSRDNDCKNRLWEAFRPEPLDNGCPITWALFTRGYFGDTEANNVKMPGGECQFVHADVALSGISDALDIGIFVAGALRGQFKKILQRRISAVPGLLSEAVEITEATELFETKPQSRRLRTEDSRLKDQSKEQAACPVEHDKIEDYDESFQLLLVGSGPATIRWIRPQASPEVEDAYSGVCEDETNLKAVRFDGVGAEADTEQELLAAVSAFSFIKFSASLTATVSFDGVTETGSGYSTSVISQEAADRAAETIARETAAQAVVSQLPVIYSLTEPSSDIAECSSGMGGQSLAPIVTPWVPGGATTTVVEDGVTITWPHIPGVLCYTIYKLVNGEYVVVAECVSDPEIIVPPGGGGCYKLTGLSGDGEFPAGEEICLDAPVIIQHPQTQVVTAPVGVTFSVLATGSAPLSYQWYRNGVPIPGAVGASYSIPATVVGDSGSSFSVVVSNEVGVATSNPAGLTVLAEDEVIPPGTPPYFILSPVGVSVTAPASADFSVIVGGTSPIAVQWYRDGVAVPGATGFSYSLPTTSAADDGAIFYCRASNASGAATSISVLLNVTETLSLGAVEDQTVQEPNSATFSVAVLSGDPPFTFKWFQGGVEVPTAITSSFTTTATTVATHDGLQYQVEVSDANETVLSNSAFLSVAAAPQPCGTESNYSLSPAGIAELVALAEAHGVSSAASALPAWDGVFRSAPEGTNPPYYVAAPYWSAPQCYSVGGKQYAVYFNPTEPIGVSRTCVGGWTYESGVSGCARCDSGTLEETVEQRPFLVIVNENAQTLQLFGNAPGAISAMFVRKFSYAESFCFDNPGFPINTDETGDQPLPVITTEQFSAGVQES